MDKLKELINLGIKNIEETGIDQDNIETLQTLISMNKDIAKSEYLKAEKEAIEMRYRERNDYGARRRDSRGRYMRDGGRGNSRGNYGNHMPEEYFERMMDGYEDYRDGMDEYQRGGNYGAKDKGLDSLEYMLESIVCLFEHLQDTSENPEEVELIKKYARKIKEM